MKSKNLKALIKAMEDITSILKEEVNQNESTQDTPVVKDIKEVKSVKKEEVKEKASIVTKKKDEAVDTAEKDLNKMTFSECQTYAKELGLKANGTKKQIVARIEEHLGGASDTAEKEEAPKKEIEKSKKGKVVALKKNETKEEKEEPTIADKLATLLEDYTDEDLKDTLKDLGKSTKGKRQALLARILEAYEAGEIELDLDDVEEESAEDNEEEVAEEEELEFEGSEERLTAIEKLQNDLYKAYENKELKDKSILKFLKDYFNSEYESEGKEEDLENYIRIQCELVDDEGEQHGMEDPYEVADNLMCCGQHLKELEGDLYCEVCGNTYSLE